MGKRSDFEEKRKERNGQTTKYMGREESAVERKGEKQMFTQGEKGERTGLQADE